MAITIQHAPNLQLLAQSGYVAGAGFYRQQQREMALRERMQQRALDYNMMSQEIAHRNAMQRQLMAGQQNAVAQGIQNRAGLQRAMALQNDQQDFQRQMAQLDRRDRIDQFQHQMKLQRERINLTGQSFQERDMVQHLLGQSDQRQEMIDQILSDGMQYTPQDQAKADKIRENIQSITADQTLTPMAKANAIYQQALQMPLPSVKAPSMEEQIDERIFWMQDPNDPNGARKLPFTMTERNGMQIPQVVQGYSPPDSIDEDKQDPKLSSDYDGLPATDRAKIYLDVLKALTRQNKTEGGTQTELPNDAEIKARIRAIYGDNNSNSTPLTATGYGTVEGRSSPDAAIHTSYSKSYQDWYNKLPPGTRYRDINGKVRIKGG